MHADRRRHGLTRATMAAGLVLSLAGCGIFGEAPPPRLPGERVSVLDLQQTIQPDPEVAAQRIVLPQPYINDSWSQPGGHPTHAMYHLSLAGPLQELWRADTGDGIDSSRRLLSEPVTLGPVVFTLDTDFRVSAFGLADGNRRWAVSIEDDDEDDDPLGGGLAAGQGLVFATTGLPTVTALRAQDGVVIWRANTGIPVRAAPTVIGEFVLVTTLDNRLIAYDARTGRQRWTHNGVAEETGLLGAASPTSNGEIVITPYSSGEVFALDLETGRQIWTDSVVALRTAETLATISDIRAGPVLDRDLAIVLGHGDRLVAYDVQRGSRIWDRELGGKRTPWAAGDWIYVLSNNNEVMALRRRDGGVHWIRALPKFEDPDDAADPIIYYGPVLASNRLIVAASTGEVYSISPYNGRVLGILELSDGAATTPIVISNILLLLTEDGDLFAYR